MEIFDIVLADGRTTNPDKLNQYFTRIFESEDSGDEFPVNLAHVWGIGYATKEGAIKALRKKFIQSVDFQTYVTKLRNNKVGGRPATTFVLTKICAEKLISSGRRIPAARHAQRKTYFILCKEANAVKIGIAVDVADRMESLQCGNPFKLRLLLTLPINIEAKIHKKFADLRLNGEWFLYDKSIADFINECKMRPLTLEAV